MFIMLMLWAAMRAERSNEDASDSQKMELGGFRNSGKREFRTTSVVRSDAPECRFSFLLARHIFSEEDDNAQGPAVRRLYPHYTRLFAPVADIGYIDYVSNLVTMYVRLARREEQEVTEEFGNQYPRYAARTPAFLPHARTLRRKTI